MRRGTIALKRTNPAPLYFRWKYDTDFEKPNISLYKTEAIKRSELISDVKYNLFMSFDVKEGYNGKIVTKFNLSSKEYDEKELFFDFQGKAIASLQVNGEEMECDFKGQRVLIPKDPLKVGNNEVSFKFKNTYVKNSAGLHWFKDPLDQRVYLYSHLEPFFCHRIFPCFDQPDIKAPLSLVVHCPLEEWVAVGNGKFKEKLNIESEDGKEFVEKENIREILKNKKGFLHFFEDTPLQSSYIYGFFAGEFHHFSNEDPNAPVPMKIFVRQSMKDYVDHKEQFRVVTEGMRFFGNYFNYPYPFDKYDQIYCPEFRISAMENIGTITFTENFLIKQSEKSSEQLTRHMYVALHELSHMWFGDLVTMKWWEDLWLKESFADYMGALCISQSPNLTNYKNTECIFINFKFIGLKFDSRETTHPILAPIKNTEDATSVFDPISYDKGASFILMASYMLGEKVLQEAVQNYLKKFEYKNTVLNDFISCLEEAYKANHDDEFELQPWTDTWLKTKGLNILNPRITLSKDGKQIEKFEIVQSFEKYSDPTYRSQKINIAFYDEDHNDTLFAGVLVKDQEVTEVEELKGKIAPAGVLLNANNYGYCKIGFDPVSVKYFKENTKEIKSDIDRNLIYRYMWEYYRSNNIKAEDYLTLVKNCISGDKIESSMNAISFILQTLEIQAHTYSRPGKERESLIGELFDIIIELFKSRVNIQDLNMISSSLVTLMPSTKLAYEFLKNDTIVDKNGQVVNKEFKLTASGKYSCLCMLYSDDKACEESERTRIFKELTKEQGYREKLLEIGCDAVQPENKEKWWERFMDGTKMSKDEYAQAMAWFYCPAKEKIMEKYADKFFASVDDIFANKHRDYAERFIVNLQPLGLGREEDKEKFEKIYNSTNPERSHFRKYLKIAIEDLEDIISKRK